MYGFRSDKDYGCTVVNREIRFYGWYNPDNGNVAGVVGEEISDNGRFSFLHRHFIERHLYTKGACENAFRRLIREYNANELCNSLDNGVFIKVAHCIYAPNTVIVCGRMSVLPLLHANIGNSPCCPCCCVCNLLAGRRRVGRWCIIKSGTAD